jgi:hypothetical protein
MHGMNLKNRKQGFIFSRHFELNLLDFSDLDLVFGLCLLNYPDSFSRRKWVPVITAWRVVRLRTEERPPILMLAANVLSKQSRIADEGWSSCLGVGRGAKKNSSS